MNKANNILVILLLAVPVLARISCTGASSNTTGTGAIEAITSIEQFNSIIEGSGSRLIAFDLYADWCMPCHVLAPTLEEVARENQSTISFYKIDTDKFPQITEAFGVTGIPFVVFIKDKKAVYALMGVQPKESYQKIINTYADTSSEMEKRPGGKKTEGLRVESKFESGFFSVASQQTCLRRTRGVHP